MIISMVTSCDVTEKTLLTSPPALASQSKLYVDFILSNVNRRFTMKLSRDQVLKLKPHSSSPQGQVEETGQGTG